MKKQITITKEQCEILLTQMTARLDHFDELIQQASANKNMDRVEELVLYKAQLKQIVQAAFNAVTIRD